MGHNLTWPTDIDSFTDPSSNLDGKAHYKPTAPAKQQMIFQANLMAEELKNYEIKGGKLEQPTLEEVLSCATPKKY